MKKGVWLTAGTPIGTLGDDHRREAIVYLSERQISLTKIGQRVSLLVGDAPRESIRGLIIAIDSAPCDEIPPPLLRSGLVSPKIAGKRHSLYYRVRVQLDSSGSGLVVRRIGRAKVNVPAQSLAGLLYRLLSETFG